MGYKPATDSELAAIGEVVFVAAFDRFDRCSSADDFCVQSVSGPVIVFGGTNRVRWHPDFGFQPDRWYCTQRFLDAWDRQWGGEPK